MKNLYLVGGLWRRDILENTVTNTLTRSREYVYELYPRVQCLFAPAVSPSEFHGYGTFIPVFNVYPLDESEMVSYFTQHRIRAGIQWMPY